MKKRRRAEHVALAGEHDASPKGCGLLGITLVGEHEVARGERAAQRSRDDRQMVVGPDVVGIEEEDEVVRGVLGTGDDQAADRTAVPGAVSNAPADNRWIVRRGVAGLADRGRLPVDGRVAWRDGRLLGAMLVPAASIVRRTRDAAMLPVAGLCAVCGMLCFYHRHYDTIMLFPAVLAAMHAAAASPTGVNVAVATSMLVSVLIPKRVLHDVPLHESLQAVIWIAAATLPLAKTIMFSRNRGGNTHAQ